MTEEDKKDILNSIMDTPNKPKKKKKVVGESIAAIETTKKNEITDVISSEEDAVVLTSSPDILSRLKESVFVEGLHYIVQVNKSGQKSIFFKKQASSVLAELFEINVRIVSTKIESYIPPASLYILDKIFESTQELIRDGKMKPAGNLIEYAKELATDKNPAEWWRAEVILEADNGKRKIEWTGSAVNALENVALSIAITRAFRNLIRIFGGL